MSIVDEWNVPLPPLRISVSGGPITKKWIMKEDNTFTIKKPEGVTVYIGDILYMCELDETPDLTVWPKNEKPGKPMSYFSGEEFVFAIVLGESDKGVVFVLNTKPCIWEAVDYVD